MNCKLLILGVIVLSFFPNLTCLILEKLEIINLTTSHSGTELLKEVLFPTIGLLGFYLLLRRGYKDVHLFIYVLAMVTSTCIKDGNLAMELDGHYETLSIKFAREDYPFIEQTGYMTMCCYWHGIVHYILVIAAIALYTRRESHREIILYFLASNMNWALVMWPTLITGDVKIAKLSPLIGKACVHLLAGVVCIGLYLTKRPAQARTYLKFDPVWKRPVDLVFFLYFLWALVTSVFRGLAVEGGTVPFMKTYLKTYDPFLAESTGFSKSQAMTSGYINMVYYVFALYGLLYPGQHWMADFSILHAGASAQAEFVYMSSSVHWRTPKMFQAPLSGQAAYVFWGVHIALFVMPQLFALWCQRDAEKFGRTYSTELATPVKTYSVVSSRRQTGQKKAE